ncbi:hypothetical protein [Bacillus sp. P14.5]|uniref:hypothetical protein n=1 Tax=Bacillus sp. P14.5 TaxID=1983400 RepID=UPI000DE9EE89|nr:hypothetical protein [Bacillus sp. P14.5]
MNLQLNRPKGFGEILDQTFRLSKNKFLDFFLVLLILLGPIYLLQALFELLSGTSFFRQVGEGDDWFTQMMSAFEGTTPEMTEQNSNVLLDLGIWFLGLISTGLSLVASAAIIYVVNHIRKDEEYTVGGVIKKGFSRFWPLVGSSIVFGLIVFGLVILPVLIITFSGVFMFGFSESFAIDSLAGSIMTVIFILLIFLAVAVGIGYLLTRWYFYLGVVATERAAPGIGKSWNLTKGQGWKLLGVFIVLFLITGVVSAALEFTLGAFLGNSVLFNLLYNLITLITTIFLSVGFAVMFFDLKIRNDAEDLQDMIQDYKQQ